MRIMDALAAFPNIVFALVLVAITGGAMRNIILVIGLGVHTGGRAPNTRTGAVRKGAGLTCWPPSRWVRARCA